MAGRSTVLDVASYILEKRGRLTTYELQKLVYFTQAWSLAWDGRPLFADQIQAWPQGPVAPALFRAHRQQFTVGDVPGSGEALSPREREVVDAVLDYYGQFNAVELVEMTHSDQPWIDARQGLPEQAPSKRPITTERIRRFYTAQQILGSPGPKAPASSATDVPIDVVMDVAERQMKKWRSTLDWLAVR